MTMAVVPVVVSWAREMAMVIATQQRKQLVRGYGPEPSDKPMVQALPNGHVAVIIIVKTLR